jgi:hypothetical protein
MLGRIETAQESEADWEKEEFCFHLHASRKSWKVVLTGKILKIVSKIIPDSRN